MAPGPFAGAPEDRVGTRLEKGQRAIRPFLVWALISLSLLGLAAKLPGPSPRWSETFWGNSRLALDRVEPGKWLGQALRPGPETGPISYLKLMFATYSRRAEGELTFVVLKGGRQPKDLAEVSERAVFHRTIQAQGIADNEFYRIDLPLIRDPGQEGLYLIFKGEPSLLATPVSVWLAESRSWPGPAAEVLEPGHGGSLKASPIPGSLSLELGNDLHPSVLSELLSRGWGWVAVGLGLALLLVLTLWLDSLFYRRVGSAQQGGTWSEDRRDLILIALFTLAVHGLLLINDGIFWDGWLIFAYHDHWDLMREAFFGSGLPVFAYLHRFLGALPEPVLAYRAATWLSILVSALAIYGIFRLTGLVRPPERLWNVLLFLAYPAYRTYDQTTMTPFHLFLASFMVALLVALGAEGKEGFGHLWRRLAAVVLFLFSFNMNSLLVFYLAAFLLILVQAGRIHGQGPVSAVWTRWWKRPDYLVLPLAYFIPSKLLFPTYGTYAEYNAFTGSLEGMGQDVLSFLDRAVAHHLLQFAHQMTTRPVLTLAALAIFLLILTRVRSRSGLEPAGAGSGSSARLYSLGLILAGLGLFILAAAPYAAVGKSPTATGMETRYAFLVGLPLGLVLVGAVRALAPPGRGWPSALGTLVLTGFLLWSGLNLIDHHLTVQARWVKDRSIMSNLERLPRAREISIFWIRDHYPIGEQRFYRFFEWSSIFKRVWGGESRVGFDLKRYSPESLADYRRSFNRIFNLSQVDPRGRQARLFIQPGSLDYNPLGLVVYYKYYALFRSGKLEDFLSQVTSLRLEPY